MDELDSPFVAPDGYLGAVAQTLGLAGHCEAQRAARLCALEMPTTFTVAVTAAERRLLGWLSFRHAPSGKGK